MTNSNLNDLPYISLSHKYQRGHEPKILNHRMTPQSPEKFRVYYTKDSKHFFMVCINKKNKKGFIGGAGDLLRIVNNHFKRRDSMELLFCHPTTFGKQKELKNLLNTNEQSLQRFLLLLT